MMGKGRIGVFREMIRITASVMTAAGSAILKFSRNLSFIRQPCPLQAAMVVSLMKERLSPNMAPPMTEATQKGSGKPVATAKGAAIGVMRVMVPTEVPMASETKQLTKNRITTENWEGTWESSR